MTPAELQASAAAYEKRIPAHKLPYEEKYDPKQPHLQEEAVLVDLLNEPFVDVYRVPSRYWSQYNLFLRQHTKGVKLHRLLSTNRLLSTTTTRKYPVMTKWLYHKFYNHLIALESNENNGDTK